MCASMCAIIVLGNCHWMSFRCFFGPSGTRIPVACDLVTFWDASVESRCFWWQIGYLKAKISRSGDGSNGWEPRSMIELCGLLLWTYFLGSNNHFSHRGHKKMKTSPRKREQDYSRQNNGQISKKVFIYWMCFLLRACLHPQDFSYETSFLKLVFNMDIHGYLKNIWKYIRCTF